MTASRGTLEVTEDPINRASALNQLGVSLFAAGRSTPEEMQGAEAAFREVLEIAGDEANVARYSLAEVLLQQERDEEGTDLLQMYLAQEPNGVFAKRAQALVENPLRARVNLMPDFELVTLSGEYLTSYDLEGKVVIFDFWGTWCAPCVAAIPHLRNLSRRSSKQPFLIVSISNDSDEEMLRQFVAEKRMSWLHHWDPHREIIEMFRVRTYPTYVLVDADGVMIFRQSGWSQRIANELSGQINSAIRRQRKTTQEAKR